MLGLFSLIEGLGLLAVSNFAIARKVATEVQNVAQMLQTGSAEVAAAASDELSAQAVSLDQLVKTLKELVSGHP